MVEFYESYRFHSYSSSFIIYLNKTIRERETFTDKTQRSCIGTVSQCLRSLKYKRGRTHTQMLTEKVVNTFVYNKQTWHWNVIPCSGVTQELLRNMFNLRESPSNSKHTHHFQLFVFTYTLLFKKPCLLFLAKLLHI